MLTILLKIIGHSIYGYNLQSNQSKETSETMTLTLTIGQLSEQRHFQDPMNCDVTLSLLVMQRMQ